MNPESNKFENLLPEEREAFIDKYYQRAPKSDIPIFKIYEKIRIKGYIFKVVHITPEEMTLRPVRKARP